MSNNFSSVGKKIDEYSLKLKINDKLSIIKEKNKFINSKLVTTENQQIPFGLINRNLIDISNILLEIAVSLQSLTEMISKKEDDISKENLQLAHSRLTKIFNQEKSTYQTLKTKFNLIQESVNIKYQYNINEEEENNSTINNNDDKRNPISKNDLFLSEHNANKNNDINNIYQQTLMVAKISSDINNLAYRQEDKLHSIEGNIKETDNKVIKANVHLMEKKEQNDKKYKNNFVLIIFLLFLIIFIVYLLFYRNPK